MSEALDRIVADFHDILDEDIRQEVLNNQTFRGEFQFAPGEQILYARYQKLSVVVFRNLIFYFIIMAVILGSIGGTFATVSGILPPSPYNPSDIFNLIWIILAVVFGVTFAAVVGVQVVAAKANRFIITDRRIIVGYTFIMRMYRSFYFDMILDIIVQQGPISRLLHAGSVLLMTASDEGTINLMAAGAGGGTTTGQRQYAIPNGLVNIPDPVRVKQLIRRLMRRCEGQMPQLPPLNILPISIADSPFAGDIDLLPDEQVFKKYARTNTSSFCFLGGIIIPIIYVFFEFFDYFAENPELFFMVVQWMVVAIIVLVIFILILSRFHARGHFYVVTDRRIITYKRFLSIVCRDAIMGMITEVSLQQMASGRVANFGRIKVMTKGFENNSIFGDLLSIDGVPNAPIEKDAVFNIVLYFQEGRMFDPLHYEDELTMLGL